MTCKRNCDGPEIIEAIKQAELESVYGCNLTAKMKSDLWGIALSGGGIRSATFSLGVMQSIASQGLLGAFHYQSTVSGGGYTGAFIQGLIERKGFEATIDTLTSDASSSNVHRPIRHLREYSNYLSPRKGLLSGDTLAMVFTYLRNVLLIQMQVIALVSTLCVVPLWMQYATQFIHDDLVAWALLGISALCWISAVLAVGRVGKSRPLDRSTEARPPNPLGSPRDEQPSEENFKDTSKIVVFATVGLVLGSVGLGLHNQEIIHSPFLPLTAGLLYVGIWGGWLFVRGQEQSPETRQRWQTYRHLFFTATLGCAVLAGALVWLARKIIIAIDNPETHWPLVTIAPMILLATIMVVGIIHVGLAGRALDDLQREMWARVSGHAAGGVIVFCAGACLAVYGPWYAARILSGMDDIPAALGWSAIIGGAGTILGGVFAAGSSKVGEKRTRAPWLDLLAKIAPGVFLIAIFVAVSAATQRFGSVLISTAVDQACRHCDHLKQLTLIAPTNPVGLLVFTLSTFLVWQVFSRHIDVNEFSMNAFYRNRLVRCYLGASNEKRNPEPTTNFDPNDDIPLDSIGGPPSWPAGHSNAGCQDDKSHSRSGPDLSAKCPPESGTPASPLDRPTDTQHTDRRAKEGMRNGHVRPLFPLMCTALNLVDAKQLDWQDRRAASFFFTPLYSGYIPPPSHDEANAIGTWRIEPSNGDRLARRFSLGDAMAISGAAVSPNMGYHSSPVVTALLTIFDVRLGWWMRNPCKDGSRGAHMPNQASFQKDWLLNEMLGRTREEGDYIYLSDGGHFENLGAYELIRRRCSFILCVDATADLERTFEDLGNLIDKSRRDFACEIEIDCSALIPGLDGRSQLTCAIGRIEYAPVVDPGSEPNGVLPNMTGVLLYIKPSLTGREKQDVATYASAHPSFPHEPTSDQYFDEAQFECYRRLGRSAGDEAFGDALAVARQQCRDADFSLPSSPIKNSFVNELTSRLSRRTNISSEASSRTATLLSSIYSQLRSNKALASLDADFYPAWDAIQKKTVQSGRAHPLPTNEDFRECFYFCQQLIQFMGSVYRDMDLEHLAEHPDNRGWMNTFRQWSWSPMFRLTWTTGSARLGKGFVDFCRKSLSLPDPNVNATADPDKSTIKVVEVIFQPSQWDSELTTLLEAGSVNELEYGILKSGVFEPFKDGDTKIFLLKLDWSKILVPEDNELGTTTIGVAVVCNETIKILRVQNHVRFMGLATLFIKGIREQLSKVKRDITQVVIDPGDYGQAGYCGKAEAAKVSVRLQAILDRLRI